jgi:hypothetical protein
VLWLWLTDIDIKSPYSGLHFRPHMGTSSFFAPKDLKWHPGKWPGRLIVPTKPQGPFSERSNSFSFVRESRHDFLNNLANQGPGGTYKLRV